MADESLGEAYVKINADTSAFKGQLDAGVSKALAATEKAAKASADRTARAVAAAAKSSATETEKAAADAAKAQMRYNAEVLADMRRTATEIAAAEKAAYAEVAAAAKAAAASQAESSRAAALSTKNSFGGSFAKQIESTFSLKSLGASFGKFSANIPSDIFGAITTSAKYAAIGVIGLGAALAAIGIENAAKQQAALVGFTALADQIAGTTDKVTGLNVALAGLSQAQSKAIGNNFLQQLIQLSNNSALSQSALQDTSQQLLALGFNGDQSIGIIKDIGNALAASGKSGGGLNDDLKGIVTAFAQIKGSGRLLAQDLNQITTRIPAATRIKVYQDLAKNLHLAGANAKEGTPEFAKMTKEVQKLAKAGGIDADTAIASITKTLEGVPGAARDAVTGLDALGRQNLTLSGRFEALKDNIRTSLAQAFLIPGEGGDGKSLADQLADQLGKLIPTITATIKDIGPKLASFVTQFAGVLIKVLPQVIAFVGQVFDLISKGIDLATTKGNPINDIFVGIKNTFEGLMPIIRLAFDLILPGLVALGPAFRIFGDGIKIIGDLAGALDKLLKPIAYITSAGIYAALKLIADGFDLITKAAGYLGDAADFVQKKFIEAISFVLDKVEKLIKALDFHVGPIHIEVPGADAAIGKIEDLRSQLNSIPSSVSTAVNIITNRVDANGGIIQGGLLNGQTVHDSESARAAGINAAAANKSTADELAANAALHPTGGGSANSAATKAATAAKAAADKVKAAFADLAGDIKTIGDHTAQQTAAQIKTNFNALIKDLTDSGHKSLVAAAKKTEELLIADAKKLKPLQDKIAAELNIAQPIRDNIIASGSVTTPTQGIGQTFLGITNQLNLAIAQSKEFASIIKQLQAKGLDATTLRQLIDAGPAAGLAAARALLQSGDIGISLIKTQQATLADIGTGLANSVVDPLFLAGQHAADGLISGLQSKEKDLEAEMKKYGDLVSMKKILKIQSPSKVMMETGKYAMEGLALGLGGNLAPVQRASASAASSVIFGPGSISVTGNMNRPEQTGLLLGQGIVGVLQQRQAQAALNGTG